jgi:putrescine aminotransferase
LSTAKASEILDKALGIIEKETLDEAEKKALVDDCISNFNQYINPGILKYRKSVSHNEAVVEWSDCDSYFTDLYGEQYFDCLGGFGIFNFGHRNQEIVKYVKAQLDRQALHSQELLDPLRGYLAEAMAEVTPGDLQFCFFTNGGAEAVEMALKLARIASGKPWLISSLGGFHGKSMGALSVGGKATYRVPYLPIVQQVAHVVYGDIDDLRLTLEKMEKTGEDVAAIILEPVQGEGGVIVPPPGYLKAVRVLCDEHKIFLIIDEIQTGMGRTGAFFRCEAEGVVPDIMTYGKAFGGGIMPITGIIARPHLWVEPLVENPWLLGSPTFGGNPLACSAALAALKYMISHDVAGQAKEKGAYLKERIEELRGKHPQIIKEVRGVGLLIGIEFTHNDLGYKFAKGMFARKVMTAGTLNNAAVIRIEPPLTMSRADFDIVLERMEETLTEIK